MKTIFFFIFVLTLSGILSLQVGAQTQATSVDQTNADGMQCSSAGVGYGKDNQEAQDTANKNREKAVRKAKINGDSSFSNKTGGGTAICIKYRPKAEMKISRDLESPTRSISIITPAFGILKDRIPVLYAMDVRFRIK